MCQIKIDSSHQSPSPFTKSSPYGPYRNTVGAKETFLSLEPSDNETNLDSQKTFERFRGLKPCYLEVAIQF